MSTHIPAELRRQVRRDAGERCGYCLNEAQNRLAHLIGRLSPGEVVTITENERPVAQIIPVPALGRRSPRPRPPVTGVPTAGQYEGRLVVPDDFDAPLEALREYLE